VNVVKPAASSVPVLASVVEIIMFVVWFFRQQEYRFLVYARSYFWRVDPTSSNAGKRQAWQKKSQTKKFFMDEDCVMPDVSYDYDTDTEVAETPYFCSLLQRFLFALDIVLQTILFSDVQSPPKSARQPAPNAPQGLFFYGGSCKRPQAHKQHATPARNIAPRVQNMSKEMHDSLSRMFPLGVRVDHLRVDTQMCCLLPGMKGLDNIVKANHRLYFFRDRHEAHMADAGHAIRRLQVVFRRARIADRASFLSDRAEWDRKTHCRGHRVLHMWHRYADRHARLVQRG
jgi:hypothetical protein